LEITASHRQEIESESDRSRAWQTQMEKTTQARERAYKQKTKGLEEQVSLYKQR
jgi:rootletin